MASFSSEQKLRIPVAPAEAGTAETVNALTVPVTLYLYPCFVPEASDSSMNPAASALTGVPEAGIESCFKLLAYCAYVD